MMHRHRIPVLSLCATAALPVIALLNLSCGGDGPTQPPLTVPKTVPAPTPNPVIAACFLGEGTLNTDCEHTSERLLSRVEAAMDRLVEKHPEIFNLEDEDWPGTHAYRVLDQDAYMEGLVAELQADSMCAEIYVDTPAQDIVLVKDSNDFSEEYDVLTSKFFMRRGDGSYRYTCTPASFPVERPDDWPPVDSGCYPPFPPEINRMKCHEHTKGDGYTIIDSTPLVVGPLYCEAIGYTDGRAECPVRPEGALDREACENWRVGDAEDTERPGPTWKNEDGGYCTGPESGCQNSDDNQYQLWAYKPGRYGACAQTGSCCEVVID